MNDRSDTQTTHDTSEPTVEALEADIAHTREELADTVDQLAAKLDVKSRAKGQAVHLKERAAEEAHTLRDRATDDDGRPTPPVVAAVGGLVAGLVAVLVVAAWRRSAAR